MSNRIVAVAARTGGNESSLKDKGCLEDVDECDEGEEDSEPKTNKANLVPNSTTPANYLSIQFLSFSYYSRFSY